MVTVEYIAMAATRAYRLKQTLISWSTLRALGIEPPVPIRRGGGVHVRSDAYASIGECFENRESPMSALA